MGKFPALEVSWLPLCAVWPQAALKSHCQVPPLWEVKGKRGPPLLAGPLPPRRLQSCLGLLGRLPLWEVKEYCRGKCLHCVR